MVGMLSALIAAASWLVLATFLKLPVSTTHGMGMCLPYSLLTHPLGEALVDTSVGAMECGGGLHSGRNRGLRTCGQRH